MGNFCESPANNASKTHAFLPDWHLVGSTGDEEPLVNAWVNWGGGEVLVGWNGRKLVMVDTAWGVLYHEVGAVNMLDGAQAQSG